MSDQPDGAAAPRSQSDAAASRRWLISIMITVVFGGFGAVIAYLNYSRSSEPSSSSKSPSTAPASPPTAEPSAPASTDGDKGKGHKNK